MMAKDKLKTIVLIAELESGICHQVNLSKRQESAVLSVLASLDEPLSLIEDPLGLTIDHPTTPKSKVKL